MKKSSPFARASAMMALIASAGIHAALAKMGEYESRGHGRGGHSGKKWGPRPSGKYSGVGNGARECQRRMRQAARKAGHAMGESFAL